MSANSLKNSHLYLMANKGKGKARRAKRSNKNPLSQPLAGPPRPKMKFDGSMITSPFYAGTSATVAGAAKDYFFVDCSSTYGIARGVNGITNLYSEYKFFKAAVEYIPSIGPTSADAGGRIHVAYIDNPEKIANYANTLVAATWLGYVRSSPNVRSYNLWERFTYNVPLTYRRKTFDVNTSLGAYTTDDLDRSTQGAIIIAIETVTPVISVGTYHFTSTVMVSGLEYANTT